MRLTGVSHTGFTVSDMDRSLRFYSGLLGMKVIAQQVGAAPYLSTITGFSNVELKVALLKTGENSEHILELLEYLSHPGSPQQTATNRPGNGHLCFTVEDIWTTYERLKAEGVNFKSLPARITEGVNKGAHAVYFLDPDGFTLELFAPASSPRQ